MPDPWDTAADGLAGRESWLSAASYWTPTRLLPVSAWWEHAPFAFWLVDALRPSGYVELGTHYGYSYFAVCDAIRRLGLPTRAWAVDSWEGDDHAGFYDDSVYGFVAEVNKAQYADFSTLLRGYFSDQAAAFEDGTIDLLHIDGRHGYEDVREDFECWLPKVSERGVVILHDVAEHTADFGVWRFWEEVSQEYPSFSFEHGHGLGVLGVGGALPEPVRSFLAAGATSREEIRTVYATLGRRIGLLGEAQAAAEGLMAENATLRGQLGELYQAADALMRQHTVTAQELSAARQELALLRAPA